MKTYFQRKFSNFREFLDNNLNNTFIYLIFITMKQGSILKFGGVNKNIMPEKYVL